MKTLTLLPRILLAAPLLLAFGTLRAESGGKEKSAKPEHPPGLVKKFDKNQDGTLDETEKAALDAHLAKEKAKREEMLAKYDTNKDGKLSEEEKAAAKLDREKEKSEKMKEKAAKEKSSAEKSADKAKEKKPEKMVE